jgi:Glycosyltransferase family 87
MVAVIFDVWLIPLMTQWMAGTDLYPAWSVDLADPWARSSASLTGYGLFRHSPAIAQVASLIGWIPWLAAQVAFLAVQLAAIIAMAGRRWPYVVLFPGVFWNLYIGNVDVLMAAALVLGFRYPGMWAFLFITKVTPAIGVLWFAFRGEWRNLAIALGTTAVVVALSFALAPDLWARWIQDLQGWAGLPQMDGVPPLLLRLPVALLVVAFAARTDRRWMLPIACLIAIPNPWFVTFAILGASIALFGADRRERAHATPALVVGLSGVRP